MKKTATVGVVVGRFQTPFLHDGHRYLIDVATAVADKLLIVVGVSGAAACHKDPLDFETRAMMLKAHYPAAVIVPLQDHMSDDVWSKNLDAVIAKQFPDHEATLFGSRDSFLSYYSGVCLCREVQPRQQMCATEIREAVATVVRDSDDFRAGVMYANTKQMFPTSFQTVDMIIKHSTENKVLVGRKAGEPGFRFPGGFTDPADTSLEHTVRREAKEEVGDVELSDVRYIHSVRVDDRRYRHSQHKLMTALFTATYVYGQIKAGDDLDEVKWQPIPELLECLIETHKPLGEAFLKSIGQ